MLKKFIFSLTAIITLSLVVIAQTDKTDKTKLVGHITDKACATGKLGKEAHPQEAAANHGKGCALMPVCLKSGLGIYADGKFTAFDEKGTALAKAALEKSKKDKGAKFEVTGKVANDTMSVDDIKEIE